MTIQCECKNDAAKEFMPPYDMFPASLESLERFQYHANYRHLLYKDGYIIAATSDSPRLLTILDARDCTYVAHLSRSDGENLDSLNSTWGVIDEETDTLYLGLRRVSIPEDIADGAPVGGIMAVDIKNIAAPSYKGEYVWAYEASADPNTTPLPVVTAIDLFKRNGRKYLAIAGNSSPQKKISEGVYETIGQAIFGVLDVTDPENMIPKGYRTQASDGQIRPHGVKVVGNRWAVTGNYTASVKRIQLWDLLDPENIVMTSFTTWDNALIWAAAEYPGNPNLVGLVCSATRPQVDNGTEFLGLLVVDISNAQAIKVIGEGKIPPDQVDIRATADVPPNFIYFCKKGGKVWGLLPGGEHALHVFDCTDPYNIFFSHNAELPENAGLIMSRSCVMYELDGECRIAIGDGSNQPLTMPKTKGVYLANVEWATEYADIVYIDPSSETDGLGDSPENPRKTWRGVVQANASTAYLQKADTAYTVADSSEIIPANFASSKDSPVYFGAYGAGEKPLIKSTNGHVFHFYKSNMQGGCKIENLAIDSTDGDGVRLESAQGDSVSGLTVSKCDFTLRIMTTNDGANAAIMYYQRGNKNIRDCAVENCTFKSDKQASTNAVYIRLYQIAAREFRDFLFKGNTFNAIDGDAIRLFPTGSKDEPYVPGTLGLWRPSGVRALNNTFIDCVQPFAFQSGMKSIEGHKSEIIGNTFINSGRWDRPRVNAIQGGFMDGVEIAYNTFENVYTSAPDGAAIILDWAKDLGESAEEGNPAFISTNCLVHHNRISGCHSSKVVYGNAKSAGISLYRAKDCLIYSNWVYNCDSGIGVAGVEENKSSNNKVFNNTIMQCANGIRCEINTDNTAFENNLVMFSETGVNFNMPAASPVALRNNALYSNSTPFNDQYSGTTHEVSGQRVYNNNTVVEYPYDTGNGYVLKEGSPCRGTGLPIPADARIDARKFGFNDAPISSSLSIGAWQPE